MRTFNLPCGVGNHNESFVAYFGKPAAKANPLAGQIRWLREYRSRQIPAEVTDSFVRLLEIAETNKTNFEELLDYVFSPDKKNSPGKKALDALHVKDKVLDLAKLRKITSETPPAPTLAKPATTRLRRFEKLPKQPIYSLLKNSYVDTVDYCLEMSHSVWAVDAPCTPAARALFLGLALSAAELEDPLMKDLPDVLQMMLSPDIMHTLAITIDIAGGILSPLALGLITQAFDYPASFMFRILQPYLRVTLAQYAMTLRKTKKPQPLQQAVWLATIHPELGK